MPKKTAPTSSTPSSAIGAPTGTTEESKCQRVGNTHLTLRSITPADYGFLYQLLAQRTSDINISHRKLPSWSTHVAHWESGIYRESYMIMLDNLPAGYCYISRNNEVGIHLLGVCQGKRIGPTIIRHLIRSHPGTVLYANVAPANIRSQLMFEKMGWVEVQKTYRMQCPNGDHL